MTERELASQRASEFFEELWKRGDPWELETAAFEQDRYARLLQALAGRRYARALEVGCGNGTFTRRLARIADRVVALDVSPTAIARCESRGGLDPGQVEFRVTNIMEYDPAREGPWDLVVLSETIYYLGWLYSFFDVAWLACQLFGATREGGHLLLANTCGGVEDYLLRPWVVRTYRDLFLNVGYRLESEEVFRGLKSGAQIDVLISLFVRARPLDESPGS
jgi:SAM-dependent methyltransferase